MVFWLFSEVTLEWKGYLVLYGDTYNSIIKFNLTCHLDMVVIYCHKIRKYHIWYGSRIKI